MIWGEVINSVRRIHFDLVAEFGVPLKAFTDDAELTLEEIPFPQSIDDFDEWDELPLPPELADILPLAPVERALLEGPLLPIQQVRFEAIRTIETLFASILRLEKSWLEKRNLSSEDKIRFLENSCAVQSLKLSVKAGFNRLTPMKERQE